MKFTLALLVSTTSAISLRQLQSLRACPAAPTNGSCGDGCSVSGTTCVANGRLAQACPAAPTNGSCGTGCVVDGTGCKAGSLAGACPAAPTNGSCGDGCAVSGTTCVASSGLAQACPAAPTTDHAEADAPSLEPPAL